jgi:hypothetical protein
MKRIKHYLFRITYYFNKKSREKQNELELQIKDLQKTNKGLRKINKDLAIQIENDFKITDEANDILKYRDDRENLIGKLHNTVILLSKRLNKYEDTKELESLIYEGMKWIKGEW